jgi:hypothetical protein
MDMQLEEAAREYNEMIEAGEDPDIAAEYIDINLGIVPPPPPFTPSLSETYEESYDEFE